MIKRIQKMFALSEQGAKDMLKACASCILSNIVLMLPVGLLYWLVSDFYTFGRTERWAFYIFGCIVCVGLIAVTYYFQYNATYFATYKESGIRRKTLAEKLRRLPLSFFGKRI